MTYSSITYTDMDDFFTQVDSFLTANGWTQDEFTTASNRAAWHKGTVYVQITWDAVSAMAMYQSLSWDGSAPGSNPDDAGPLSGTRRMLFGNAPAQAELFSGTEQGAEYFFAAIEYTTGRFSQFGMGELIKKGDWTGGEWSAVNQWGFGGGAQNGPDDTRHTVLFDGQYDDSSEHAAVIHQEGWPSQAAGRKWGAIFGNNNDGGDDRAGNERDKWIGGFRDSFNHNTFHFLAFQPNSGLVPLVPIELWRREGAYRLGGFVPGIRALNITNIDVREELVVGADTWKVYPWAGKAASGSFHSGLDGGMAILKA